jgi:hypothetical protein
LLWLYRSISLISCSISSSLSHALGSGTCGAAQPINGLKIKPKPTPIHHATVHAAQTSLTHQFTFPNQTKPNQMENQTNPPQFKTSLNPSSWLMRISWWESTSAITRFSTSWSVYDSQQHTIFLSET